MTQLNERTCRLIPSRYPPVQAFESVSSAGDLAAVLELEGWTNDRLVAERLNRLPRSEWAYGRPNASVVMAAFLHASPDGARFNGPELGAWYASLDVKTAIAEVAHHLSRAAWHAGKRQYIGEYRAYLADLAGDFEDLRGQLENRPDLYDPDNYSLSQAHGESQRASHVDGILYDSVRLVNGTNAVAFKPPGILGVVSGDHWRITASTDTAPVAHRLRAPGNTKAD